MNIYTRLVDDFESLPLIQAWPDMQAIFRRAAASTPRHWRLPVIASEAVGGVADQAIPAVTAIACAHIGIILIDDLLDQDPRGEYHRIGAPATANLASAFQVAGLEAIGQSKADPEVRLLALRGLAHMILATALGQYWDMQSLVDEASYWRLIRTKSSPFFGVALYIGALSGGASPAVAEQLRILGNLYGEMIQIHDDLNDTMTVPANPDWTLGRSPLPILYAQVVNHPDRERFLELRRDVLKPDKLAEAQTILIHCGAVSYCVDQILCRYNQAREMLAGIPVRDPRGLETMLEALVCPIQELFNALSADQPVWPPYALMSMAETSEASTPILRAFATAAARVRTSSLR
jgi:geranylgeranyl diphosphate synthase type I